MHFFTNIAFFAAAQGIFLGLVLLFLKRGNIKANIFLAILIFVFSLWIAEFAAYFTEKLYSFPHLLFSTVGLPLLYGPLLLFYTQSLREQEPGKKAMGKSIKWNWLHLLPFLLHTVYYLPFFLQSADAKIEALEALQNTAQPPDFSLSFYLNESFKFLHLAIYLLIITKIYQQWKINTQAKSSLRQLHRNWVKQLLGGLALFAIFDLSHLLSIGFFQYDYLFIIGRGMLLSGALVIYYIGYSSLRQPEIIAGALTEPKNTPTPYEKSSLTQEQADQYTKQLMFQMEEARLFLNPDLKLQSLADTLEISTHHLSQVLNAYLQKSFYDFINEYRVKAAQEMLSSEDYTHLTILSIAHDAGFNNKASFNTAFKKHTGMTPSAYKKLSRQIPSD